MEPLLFINKIPPSERVEFETKLRGIAQKLGFPPNWLMSALFLESNLQADVVNATGGASGINQLMPATAKALGIDINAYRRQTATQQLDGVYKYFMAFKSLLPKMSNWQDLYLLNFFPVAVGKSDSYVIGRKGQDTYDWNSSLDFNKDGILTVADFRAFTKQALIKRSGNPNILKALGESTTPLKKK